MEHLVHKNETINYEPVVHSRVFTADNKEYYCRALHTVLPAEITFCHCCPLAEHEGDEIRCRYFDLSPVYDTASEFIDDPARTADYVQHMIDAGLARLFPEFLTDENSRLKIAEKALCFAAIAHLGSFRKGNRIPYIEHPMETMMLVSQMTDDAEVIAAAALHDVIEDTKYTAEDIRECFGSRVMDLVLMESEDKRRGQPKNVTWKIRKTENLKREKNAPVEAKMIMLADKVSNMRATLQDFRRGGHSIWLKFNMPDEHEQAWYYKSVAHVLSDLSDYDIYKEYIQMLDIVFEGVDTPELI